MIPGLVSELGRLFELGGFVTPPLVLAAAVLCYALGYRFVSLVLVERADAAALLKRARDGRLKRPRGALARAAELGMARISRGMLGRTGASRRAVLGEIFYPFQRELQSFSRVVRGIVRAAPLAGLLGTVSGMIATFDALADPSVLTDASTGVAQGISEALFSTELGLVVAIPGLVIGRLLDRREERIREELMKLKDLLALEPSAGGLAAHSQGASMEAAT